MADSPTKGKEVLPLSHPGVLTTPTHTSSFCRSGSTYLQEWWLGKARGTAAGLAKGTAHLQAGCPWSSHPAPSPWMKGLCQVRAGQRKEPPPAAWEEKQSHNKGLSPKQAPAQATVGVEAARP